MKIWNLDDGAAYEPNQPLDIELCPESISIYLPGPPGATGPIGPQGPQGPAGTTRGTYYIATTDNNVPVGQIFTLLNGTELISATLPLISSIIVSTTTQPYTVSNVSAFNVEVFFSGSDQLLTRGGFQSVAIIFPDDSLTFLPTALGWILI